MKKRKKKEKNKKITKANKKHLTITADKQVEKQTEEHKEKRIMQPKIFNLSKTTLSRYQVGILMRGLNFTPTPSKNHIELKSDVQAFTRKLRLMEFFHHSGNEKEKNDPHDSLVKPKAFFSPPRNRSKELDRQTDFLNNLEIKHNKSSKSNLSKQE